MSWKRINTKNFSWYYHDKDSTDLDLFKQFIQDNEIESCRKGKSLAPFKKFLETGRDVGKLFVNDMLKYPYGDHDYFFRKKDKSIIYVSQPYLFVDIDTAKQEIYNWANNLGVKSQVFDSSYSWYSLNSSILIIISLSNVDVIVNNTVKKT